MNRDKAIKYFNQGVAHAKKGQFELALECFNQAIKENPFLTEAYTNRGIMYSDSLEQHEQGLSDFNQAIELNPNYANYYNNRGLIYHKLKQYEKALGDFDQAINLNRRYTNAYSNRGLAYYELKQYEQAKRNMDKAIELSTKEDKKNYALLMYSRFLTEQQFEFAESYIEKIFENEKDSFIEKQHKSIYLELIEKSKDIYIKNKKLEENKRFEEMSIMATGVAHEINQPVGIIRASVGIAKNDLKENLFSVETELEPLLNKIFEQTQRLENIINNFRAFSRGDYSKCQVVDLNKLVDQTLNIFSAQFKSQNINVVIKRNLHAFVWANLFAIESVLINLLKNAKEALENRENPTIWIKINQQNQNIIIIVEDNGCGVDPNFESQLFTPFISTKSTSKGTGLGLNLSRRLIEEFNGQLTYQPTKEIGASFKITLPLFREENHHG